jgi:hypothetical protein
VLLCPEKDIERAICYLPRQPQLAIVCELDLPVLQCSQKDPDLVVLIVLKALKPSVALPFYLLNQSLQNEKLPSQQLHPHSNEAGSTLWPVAGICEVPSRLSVKENRGVGQRRRV